MGLVLHLLRLTAVVALIWSAVSVLLAAFLSALFRAQRRLGARWEEEERRREWLDAMR